MLSLSKITTKYQASIPSEVRKILHIKAGDYLEFDNIDGNIVLKKANNIDKNTLKLMELNLKEWGSKEDDEQFDYLKNLVK